MASDNQLVELVEALSETDLRLERLTSGTVDVVIAKDGREFLLQHAQMQLSRNRTAILDAISDSIALLSANGTIIAVNEAWKHYGRENSLPTSNSAIGLNYLDICDNSKGDRGSEAPVVAEGIRSVLSGRSASYSIEYPCHSPVEKRWFLLRVTPVADQWPVGALVMHIDVTARKRAEESVQDTLKEGLEEFQALANSMPQMVWATRPDGWCTYFNQQWFEYTGLKADESCGHGWNKPFHPQDQIVAWEAWQQATTTDHAYSIECRLRRADGVYRWWLIRGVPQRDARGNILKWYGTCTDIHDLKQTQLNLNASNLALIESDKKFHELANAVTDVFSVTCAKTRQVLYVNPAFENVFGIPCSRLYADSSLWSEAIVASQREGILASLSLLGPKTPAVNLEYQIQRPDGSLRWIFGRRFAIFDSEGTIVRVAGIARDNTDYRAAVESLRELNDKLEARVRDRTSDLEGARLVAQQASESKSTFLATMSHEIRTPMNGVIGMLEVLQQSSLKGKQVEMVNLITESAYSLLDIIEDILDFSKIEAGKLQISSEPMRLAEVVEKSCTLLQSNAQKQNVQLLVFVDPAIPASVIGDEKRLRQVLINLVSNAIKFSIGREHTGEVSVRAILVKRAKNVASIDLIVADNGIGMDQPTIDHLFRPFVQADASTARRFGGTGLGLAIAQSLVHMMGGTISVHSKVRQGSTFTVHLSVGVSEVASNQEQTAPLAGNGSHSIAGLRCRVIGAESQLADVLVTYFSNAAAIVERSVNLSLAAAEAQTKGPWVWVILPDQRVPQLEVLRAMPAGQPEITTRFVVIKLGGMRLQPRLEDADIITIDVDTQLRTKMFLALERLLGPDQREPGRPESGSELGRTLTQYPHQSRHQGHLILVAEDNETNRIVILEQLRVIGLDAEIAVNGREALYRWRRGGVSMLLTDLHMPEMDGYELAATIRAEETTGHRMPILALTANAVREEEQRCLEIGMDAYLTKPIRLSQLKAAIEKWLDATPEAKPMLDSREGAKSVPPADLNVLADTVGDDPAVIRSVLISFRQSAERAKRELEEGANGGSMLVVSEVAHKLKSSARAIGANQLGETCAAIEQVAESGSADRLRALLQQFQFQLEALMRFLASQ